MKSDSDIVCHKEISFERHVVTVDLRLTNQEKLVYFLCEPVHSDAMRNKYLTLTGFGFTSWMSEPRILFRIFDHMRRL